MAYISFQPHDHFNTKLYTGNSNSGNSNTQSITGVGFQPDWVWIKNRGSAADHALFDAVRGVTKMLNSNNTEAQETVADTLTAFDSDGFTLGTDLNQGVVNNLNETFVSWNWKANGAGSSNSDGTITSTVSANTTAGFSIVKYTGTGAVGTIGHGLGLELDCIIMKQIDDNSGYNWKVYLRSRGANKVTALDTNGAESTNTAYLNNTDPTSSVFTVGADGGSNKSGDDMIAYCFAEKTGFSKFGTYLGNGSATNGPFIYTGFNPGMVIIKYYSGGAENWRMFDNKRIGYNPNNYKLYPSLNNTEGTSDLIDLYSNGFKPRSTSVEFNGDGNTYAFFAFAAEPFVASNGDPALAR